MSYPAPVVAGDQCLATDFNDFALNPVYTYGETLAARDVVYLKNADGKIWKADANTKAQVDAVVGVVITAGNADATNRILGLSKVVTGGSGFTAGSPVYVSDTPGPASASAGTYEGQVGIAISATAYLITLASKANIESQVAAAVAALRFVDKLNITTTSVTFTNSTAENILFTINVPGGTLSTNSGLRVRFYLSDLDLANAADTITLKLKYGATTMVSIVSPTFGINNLKAVFEATIVAVGATNSQKAEMHNAAVNSNSACVQSMVGNGTAVEDSTGALNLVVTATILNEGASGNNIVLDHVVVEIIQ